eukprot:9577874-Heterocapsa_arctica.AAC.1
MKTVKSCLALFLVYRNPKAAETAGSEAALETPVVYGAAAATARYAAMVQAGVDKTEVPYIDLAVLQCFSWLLDPAQQKELKKIGSAMISKKGGEVGAPATKKAKKGSVAPSEVNDMVALLFKR